MSHYKNQKLAYQDIDKVVERRNNFSISLLILEITKLHEVSPLSIKKRLQLHEKTKEDMLIEGDEVKFL